MSQALGCSDPILVFGGTGHLGRDLVASLLAQGMRVRIFARQPGSDARVEWAEGDLATGVGLAAAFSGVRRVIHAATNSPIAQRGAIRAIDLLRTPKDVDFDGTRRVLELAHANQLEHFVYVSIAGLEDSKLPYSRVKLAGEQLVRSSNLPWSVVRATPYYYLVDRMLDRMHRWPLWCLPNSVFQPIDTRDVANYLVNCVREAPAGMRRSIGGPELTSYAQMARAHLAASNVHRRILEFSLPEQWARQAGIVIAEGHSGSRTWAQWLADKTVEGPIRSGL